MDLGAIVGAGEREWEFDDFAVNIHSFENRFEYFRNGVSFYTLVFTSYCERLSVRIDRAAFLKGERLT